MLHNGSMSYVDGYHAGYTSGWWDGVRVVVTAGVLTAAVALILAACFM